MGANASSPGLGGVIFPERRRRRGSNLGSGSFEQPSKAEAIVRMVSAPDPKYHQAGADRTQGFERGDADLADPDPSSTGSGPSPPRRWPLPRSRFRQHGPDRVQALRPPRGEPRIRVFERPDERGDRASRSSGGSRSSSWIPAKRSSGFGGPELGDRLLLERAGFRRAPDRSSPTVTQRPEITPQVATRTISVRTLVWSPADRLGPVGPGIYRALAVCTHDLLPRPSGGPSCPALLGLRPTPH